LSAALTTFRDPAGSLTIEGERVFRTVRPEFADDCLKFLSSETAQSWIASGRLIETRVLHHSPGEQLELEHQRVFFPSYPWEWTPGQWISAAELTLDFAEAQLAMGRVLKDATPLNILFQRGKPVFVDVRSSQVRDLQDPLWMAYGQFVRTFVLPLTACKYLGWPLASSLTRRDGYNPADIYPHLSAWSRFREPLFSYVTLAQFFEGRSRNSSARKLKQRPDAALYMHRRRIASLRAALRKLSVTPGQSRWSSYPETADHYSAQDREQKRDFIERILETARPARVLDLGGNTGEYSRLAAKFGAHVVALDTDVAAAEHNRRAAVALDLPILSLGPTLRALLPHWAGATQNRHLYWTVPGGASIW